VYNIDYFEMAWSFDTNLIQAIIPNVIEQVSKYTMTDHEYQDWNLKAMFEELLALWETIAVYQEQEDILYTQAFELIRDDFDKAKEILDRREIEYKELRKRYMEKLAILLPYMWI
jgi:hypothetical protein